mmetsp:Transcript_29239/g.26660  ORF Transcript_29239/g.26660 Transcript_29239/m.26660 type:complete len:107 (+) Transcript_29239:1637-1957(+)
MKNIFELFLNCPETSVRVYTTQVVLHAINVIIQYHNFELNADMVKAKEDGIASLNEQDANAVKLEGNILKFLDAMITILPTEVAKNWLKFHQYLEFWRDFCSSGES